MTPPRYAVASSVGLRQKTSQSRRWRFFVGTSDKTNESQSLLTLRVHGRRAFRLARMSGLKYRRLKPSAEPGTTSVLSMRQSPRTAPPPLIEVRQLCFSRSDEPIFGPMAFALEAGEVLLVEGANGSGKTTLLRVLAGLLELGEDAGEILREGVAAAESQQALAFLGHASGLKLDLSPRENLRFTTRLGGLRAGASIHAALLSVGLDGFEDTPMRYLSAGQRKRAALAGILSAPVALWLLDEPYANLDQEGHVLVDRLLETHAARGGAAIITSHGMTSPAIRGIRRLRMECHHE